VLSRRQWLSALALAPTGALAGAGCRGRSSATTVRFWNGFTGPDGRTMLALVKRFNAANPDIHVLMQRMDWATYYNKLFVAGLGDRAPEVFVLQTHAMPRFARARFVRPIDDLVAGVAPLDTGDIDPNVYEAVHIGDSHFGIPLDIWTLGMYYNRTLFEQAGVTAPPTDKESFLDAALKITRKGSGAEPDRWGFVFTNLESNVYTIMRQFGGAFFTPDNRTCIVHHPQNVAALQFCADLIRRYKVAPSPENYDAWIGFRQGKIGMVFEGIYMLADLQKQSDLAFGGAPVPTLGTQRAVWTGSHNLCLRADLQGASLDAAWRFVRFLSDNSLDWAQGGQVPVRRSLRATERFAKMEIQSAFATQIPFVRYLPRLTVIFEFQTEFGLAIEKALRGRATPDEALATAQTNINRILARDRRALESV
jgi:multiple sugar transport system substrate-binding protein